MIDTIIQVITTAFPLIFTVNLLMSVVKFFADQSVEKYGLRVALGILSVVGTISTASLTGAPVNFDSISSIALNAIIAAVVGIGAHFSYKVIKGA